MPHLKIYEPSTPDEARELLGDVAAHFEAEKCARPRYRFFAEAIRRFLSGGTPTLEAALGLTPLPESSKRGRPSLSDETAELIIELLNAKQRPSQIAAALGVKVSSVLRVRASRNKAFQIRQHEAKPDKFSAEDAATYAAGLPKTRRIAFMRAMISAKDLLSE